MNPTDLRHAVDVLLAADPTCADRNELSDMIKTSNWLRSWLDSVDLKCSRQARSLADAGRSEPANSLNGQQGRRSDKEAKRIADRKRVGESMGDFENALGDGKVSGEHLDALAVAAIGKSDADELDDQRRRSLVKHWVDKITGMHHTHLELDPIRDAKSWSIINAQLATRRQRQESLDSDASRCVHRRSRSRPHHRQ